MKLFFTTIFTACFLFLGVPTYAANTYNPTATIEDLKQLRNDLNERIDQNNETTTKLYDGVVTQQSMMADNVGKQMDGVGLQITQSEKNLSQMGTFLAILGIGLGVWVGSKYDQIKKIQKLVSIEKKEIEEHMNKQSNTLFQRIQRGNIEFILSRLEETPEDVANLAPQLLTVELQQTDFNSLLKSFNKYLSIHQNIPRNGPDNNIFNYCVVFIQHFPLLSLENTFFREKLEEYLIINGYSIVDNMFERDFISFCSGFATFLLKNRTALDVHQYFIKKIFYAVFISKRYISSQHLKTSLMSHNVNIPDLLRHLLVHPHGEDFTKWLLKLQLPEISEHSS